VEGRSDSTEAPTFDKTLWQSWNPFGTAPSAEDQVDHPVPWVLVAAAGPELRSMIDQVLGGRCRCEHVSTGDEVQERLAAGSPELLLWVLGAHAEDSGALLNLVASEYPTVVILLITDEEDPAIADQAFALGVHGYLLEPVQPGNLLIATMNALRQRELEVASRARDRSLEAHLQKIIDIVPVAVYARNRAGRYVMANATANELGGPDGGGIVGLTDGALMSAASARRAAETDDLVFDGGSGFKAEEIREHAGVSRMLKIVKFPLLDEGGEVIAVGSISTDITAESEAIRLRDELGQAQRAAIEDLRLSRQETVERLARAIDSHDPSTGKHVLRMGAIVGLLAGHLHLDPEEVDLLRLAAPMHDVGKIATPDEILRKRGPLNDEERAEMERHTLVGGEILAGSEGRLLQLAASIALTHHERYDGSGYPRKLLGVEIPLEGRIAAVADVFDALLSDRVYRPALTVEAAVEVMKAGRDTQFDPEIVDLLLEHIDEVLDIRGPVAPALNRVGRSSDRGATDRTAHDQVSTER
jgi:response regulator RpfG family c-di-GMP phosphodiesterase